ncbi:hypothetical protein PoB_001007000 [Plakobranchus ocellatus]|uniref:Uncharacterized protein n=1 Tax=Plakobranchus ocellatus TaxID=259542 RepID=A0AAV3YLF5_9GAST|nr:hypothetical protein PoB_001007000 [Plakobranchus ocellatus]
MLGLRSGCDNIPQLTSRMRRLPCWCGDALLTTAIFFLVVPSAFSMHLVLRDDDVGLDRNDFVQYVNEGDQLSRHIEKRQHHDTWSLCPPGMSSVDCFYVYLDLYDRLRREGAQSAGGGNRMPGKRSLGNDVISTDSDDTHIRGDFIVSRPAIGMGGDRHLQLADVILLKTD